MSLIAVLQKIPENRILYHYMKEVISHEKTGSNHQMGQD
jgi:hypothetical protein